jgi:hypothetical protein
MPENTPKKRISKTTSKFMIFAGIVFDLIPLGLVVIMMMFIFAAINGSGIGENLSEIAEDTAKLNKAPADSGGGYGADIDLGSVHNPIPAINVGINAGIIFFKTGGAGIAAVAGGIIAGPIIYTIGSFVATICGYLFFTFWFLFKGVNIWSFSSTKRVIWNGITGFIETVPILNMLPGTTLMVWKHISITNAEDMLKHNEAMKKVAGVLNKT